FPDIDVLRDSGDAGHPRVAVLVRIQDQQSLSFLRITSGSGFPLLQAAGTVQASDGVNVVDELTPLRQRPSGLDLQVLSGLADSDTIVLCKALEQLDALLRHTVPVGSVRILQRAVLENGPLLEQRGCGILSPEVGG